MRPINWTPQQVQAKKITGYYMIKTIEMSYLILVDEEKHDGQNLQEEDEQEEDEELRRRNGNRKES